MEKMIGCFNLIQLELISSFYLIFILLIKLCVFVYYDF